MTKNGFGEAYFAWTGGRAPWAVRSAIADGLERAAAHVKRTMRRNISTPYPPASKPNKFPHMRRPAKGLRANIDVYVNRKTLQAFIGPNKNAPHAKWLEEGTTKMKKRPFILRSLMMEKKRVVNTINRAAKIAFNKEAAKTRRKGRK